MDLDKIDLEYHDKKINIENAIGGKTTVFLAKLIGDTTKSYWPQTMDELATVLEYIVRKVAQGQPEKDLNWKQIWILFNAIKDMAPVGHGIPRSLVGEYFQVLSAYQAINFNERLGFRETTLLHGLFGELIAAYTKTVIRANHSTFVTA